MIHLLFDLSRRWFATPARLSTWTGWQRTVFFSGTPLLGVALGWPLGVALAGNDVTVWISSREGNNIVMGSVLMALTLTFLFHHFFSARAKQITAEKRATEAQLRLLQAQIEPHFLFNTLANVQSLMDHDLPKARVMLASFTDYLRASMTTLRNDSNPLAEELALAQNYLQLQQARMEDRLQFSITASDAARAQPLPPLLLQPLVENAVKHGLEPSIAGGAVHISARIEGAMLVLEVRDNGLGLDAPMRPGHRAAGAGGTGMALDNIRQRLLTRYGSTATLLVSASHPGTLARISVPAQLLAATKT